MIDTGEIVRLSLQISTIATLLDLPFAILLGWILARGNFRGKIFIDTLANLPLVLPPVITGYILLVLLGRNGFIGKILWQHFGLSISFTWQAAAIAAAVIAFPLCVRAVRVAIENVDPGFAEAARTLGCNRVHTFFRITLPLAANGVVAGALLTFARCLGEFGATIMFAGNIPGETQTIPLAVFSLANQSGRESEIGILLAIAVLFACGSLIVSEILLRRWRQPGVSNND